MQSIESLVSIYKDSKYYLSNLPKNDLDCEENLLQILSKLSRKNNIKLFKDEIFDHDLAATLFREIEEELQNSFQEKNYFEVFKKYALILDIFNSLCLCISTSKNKKENVKQIIETSKESINILKFTLALKEEEISILNNIIGRQLYYLTHITYVDITSKDIEYILDEYFMYLEKQLHGYELSHSSNFGCEKQTCKDIEKYILINNSSFLLLKMTYKLQHFKVHLDYKNNKRFHDIKELFTQISSQDFEDSDIELFSSKVLNSFLKSGNLLKEIAEYNIINEKIKLLTLNTDEYKELVDIIISSKEA